MFQKFFFVGDVFLKFPNLQSGGTFFLLGLFYDGLGFFSRFFKRGLRLSFGVD